MYICVFRAAGSEQFLCELNSKTSPEHLSQDAMRAVAEQCGFPFARNVDPSDLFCDLYVYDVCLGSSPPFPCSVHIPPPSH